METKRVALAGLGALLDRSIVQIANAAVDARSFDRETIGAVTNVWDNNTFPLFRVATAGTAAERERRALAALRWMDHGSAQRRAWMIEQAAEAGHPIEELLRPAKTDSVSRDYRGIVMAPVMPVTLDVAAGLAADYDLESAEVRCLRVERAGTRLTGFVQLTAARAYRTDDTTSREPAVLNIWLPELTEVLLDSHDAHGTILRPEPGGVSIGIGAHGQLRAVAAIIRPDDRDWHLSSAGRQADALTPPRSEESRLDPPPQEGHLDDAAKAAATKLRLGMQFIRLVRYTQKADRVPVQDYCRAFAGAGEAVLDAGAQPSPRQREAAFRQLIETWAHRGGPALAHLFAAQSPKTTNRAHNAGSGDVFAPPPDPELPSDRPREAQLRMVEYTVAYSRHGIDRAASALIHLALPPRPNNAQDGPWRLRALQCTSPVRLQLRTDAFQGSYPWVLGHHDTAGPFVLRVGALTVTSTDDWSQSLR